MTCRWRSQVWDNCLAERERSFYTSFAKITLKVLSLRLFDDGKA